MACRVGETRGTFMYKPTPPGFTPSISEIAAKESGQWTYTNVIWLSRYFKYILNRGLEARQVE